MPPKVNVDELAARVDRWEACFGVTMDWEEDDEGEGFWFKSSEKISDDNTEGHWWLGRTQIENVKAGRGYGKGYNQGYASHGKGAGNGAGKGGGGAGKGGGSSGGGKAPLQTQEDTGSSGLLPQTPEHTAKGKGGEVRSRPPVTPPESPESSDSDSFTRIPDVYNGKGKGVAMASNGDAGKGDIAMGVASNADAGKGDISLAAAINAYDIGFRKGKGVASNGDAGKGDISLAAAINAYTERVVDEISKGKADFGKGNGVASNGDAGKGGISMGVASNGDAGKGGNCDGGKGVASDGDASKGGTKGKLGKANGKVSKGQALVHVQDALAMLLEFIDVDVVEADTPEAALADM